MIDLAEKLNAAAGKRHPQQPEDNKATAAQSSEKKKVSNRSITCSQDLRDRLRIMAAQQGIPMQTLLEQWMTEKLEEAGF